MFGRRLKEVVAPSPHYAGIPEVFSLAERMGIPLPEELRILAMEIVNPYVFSETWTDEVREAFPGFTDQARGILHTWQDRCGTAVGAPAQMQAGPCMSSR